MKEVLDHEYRQASATPEYAVFHDKGNEQNVFDRVDYQFTPVDSLHFNVNYTRSWFQNPNAYDNLNISNVVSSGAGSSPVFANVGNTDQRSKIETYNFAPTYTRITSPNSVVNFGAFVRKDQYSYYPSSNPVADLGPIQSQSIGQSRSLLNTGAHADFNVQHSVNNIKAGVVYGVNLANKYTVYNFLSTFSGTHYVTPRALNAELGIHF